MAHEVLHRDLHRVVVGCIIYRPVVVGSSVKHFEYLLLKRIASHPIFGGLWGVPSGGLERNDYEHLPQAFQDTWEAPLEIALRREILEESGLFVDSIEYVGSFAFIRPNDGMAVLGVRFAAKYASGSVVLDPADADDFVWVQAEEVSNMKVLGGLDEAIRKFNLRLWARLAFSP